MRLATDLGGFLGPPKGLLKRQLVSEKERSTTIVSRASRSALPPCASSAASRAAAAVRSNAFRALAGSGSRCVSCPHPTRIGIYWWSMEAPPAQTKFSAGRKPYDELQLRCNHVWHAHIHSREVIAPVIRWLLQLNWPRPCGADRAQQQK